MTYEFRLPDVGEGIHEGEIVRWLVKPGDRVEEDQPLVEIQTDKATVEIPSPVAGRILELRGREGDVVQVGSVIVVIETAGEPAAVPHQASPGADAAALPAAGGDAGVTLVPGAVHGRRVLATPATRRLARELGVDLAQVTGTGPGGRVTAEDVRAFAAQRSSAQPAADTVAAPARGRAATETVANGTPGSGGAPAVAGEVPQGAAAAVEERRGEPLWSVEPGAERRIPLRGLRKRIAEKMTRSKFTAPHVTYVEEVDVTELVAVRRKAQSLAAERGVRLTYLPFVVKAVVAALRQFPNFNASLDEERQEVVLKGYYHIGIATATDDGLMVPVIRDADRKGILQLAREIADLAQAARQRRIALEDVRGSTFTITNVGALGSGLFSTPIINYPEVAILGLHRFREMPVVRDGQVVVRTVTYLAFSFDHRVADGADAVRFVGRIKDYLEEPSLLWLEGH